MEGNGSNTIQPLAVVPPMNLGDIPVKIAEQIIAPLDAMTKKSLRLTSKDLKSCADRSPVTYNQVTLTLADNAPEIYIEMLIDQENRLELEFLKTPTGCLIKNPSEAWEKQELSPDQNQFMKKASEHFVKILGKAHITVENLVFIFDIPVALAGCGGLRPNDNHPACSAFIRTHEEFLDIFETYLKLLPHRLNVEHVKFLDNFDSNECVLKLLPYLQPGTLEKITWFSGESHTQVPSVIELDQFQRAQVLVTDVIPYSCIFGNFKHLHFAYANNKALPNLGALLNTLCTLRTEWKTVEYNVKHRFLINDFLRHLIDETPEEMRGPNSPKLVKIPNTDNFIKIEVLGSTVLITKVNNL